MHQIIPWTERQYYTDTKTYKDVPKKEKLMWAQMQKSSIKYLKINIKTHLKNQTIF